MTRFLPLLALAAAACSPEQPANEAIPAPEAKAEAPKAELPPCPFRETEDWAASVEGGRLLVTGTVDLQMAGFRPTLTPRDAGGGTAAFDLTLAPEAHASVSEKARYERTGSPRYARAEIYCGGARIAAVDVVNL